MPKNKVIVETEEALPVISEDTEITELETPVMKKEPVISILSESEQIVEGNKELIQIKKDITDGRAEHVRQTDARLAKIRELDDILTSKINAVHDVNTLVNITLPQKQALLAETINETGKLKAQAETSLAEVVKREQTLTKATAELAKQKAILDSQEQAQELRSHAMDVREKELKEAEKALDPIRKALGK